MKNIIISILLIVNALTTAGQNRIYWVHGLNDNMHTWDVYKSSLSDSSHSGTSINWYSGDSLHRSSLALNRIIGREIAGKDRAIIFGHSAGGLIARDAAAQTGNHIRAVITAGTPNKGAGIVSSINNKTFNNAAKTAINKVHVSVSIGTMAIASVLPGLAKPIASLLASCFNLGSVVGKGLADDAVEEYKKYFSGKAAVADMNPDLSKNRFLRNLNAETPEVPIINIYGNEDNNRLVRISGTFMHKKDVDSEHNTDDKTYDETAFKYYNGALITCNAFEALHYTAGLALSTLSFFNPSWIQSSVLNIAAAASWTGTRRYIQYDSHNEWDRAIGAVHTERIQEKHRFLWWRWSTYKYVTIYENSDGFIPNKSSMMDEGIGPYIKNVELKGVNHLEMNSHPLMRQTLTEIYSSTKTTYSNYDWRFNPYIN